MKDQHRLALLLKELEAADDVRTTALQEAFGLLKRLKRRERRRLLGIFEQLVGRSRIWWNEDAVAQRRAFAL